MIAAQVLGGDVLEVRVPEDFAKSRFEALDVVRIRSDEEVEIGRCPSEPVETEGHGPEHGVLEPQSARRSGAPAPATRSIPDRSRPRPPRIVAATDTPVPPGQRSGALTFGISVPQ